MSVSDAKRGRGARSMPRYHELMIRYFAIATLAVLTAGALREFRRECFA